MKNTLNKILIGLAILLCSIGMIVTAADNLVTADPANPGKTKITSISVSSTQITNANSVTALAVVGVTNSTGAGDAGKIPKLNASGKLDSSLFSNASVSLVSTNSGADFTGSGSGGTWTSMFTLTTTSTNGYVMLNGQTFSVDNSPWSSARIIDSAGNVIASLTLTDYADSGTVTLPYQYTVSGIDTLSGSTKTYSFQVVATKNSRVWSTNMNTYTPWATNKHSFKILQFQ